MKNKAIVDEAEKILKDFKPVTYDVGAHLKAIEAFEVKAVSIFNQISNANTVSEDLCRLRTQRPRRRRLMRNSRAFRLPLQTSKKFVLSRILL